MNSPWQHIIAIATDIDGTLTTRGNFSGEVLSILHTLRAAGFRLFLVTGRPSGWVQGLVSYLPVTAAIAENGGVLFLGSETQPLLRNARTGGYAPLQGDGHRLELEKVFQLVKQIYPQLTVTEDNAYRLSDFTFHVSQLSTETLLDIQTIVEKQGYGFTWSTIHGHIMPQGQNKGHALQWLLEQFEIPSKPALSTLTVGDSPNDVSLFDPDIFPYSSGVANIHKYLPVMTHSPQLISQRSEGEGFIEIAQMLLKQKSNAQ